MAPIGEDRVLPIDAIPMRILPDFNEPLADVGVITLLPPAPGGDALPVAARPDDGAVIRKGGVVRP